MGESPYTHTSFNLVSSGNCVQLGDPDSDDFLYADIVRGLSRTNRYNGHTEPPVTVAHHLVFVSEMLEEAGYGPEIQMYGLLHDAPESYIDDVCRPLKNVLEENLPGFEEVYEGSHEEVMDCVYEYLSAEFEAFNLDAPYEGGELLKPVAEADNMAIIFESLLLTREDEIGSALENGDVPEDRDRDVVAGKFVNILFGEDVEIERAEGEISLRGRTDWGMDEKLADYIGVEDGNVDITIDDELPEYFDYHHIYDPEKPERRDVQIALRFEDRFLEILEQLE